MLETNQTSVVFLTDILEGVSTELEIPFKAVKEEYEVASGYEQWSGMDYICIPMHIFQSFMDTHMLRVLEEAEDSDDPVADFGNEWYTHHRRVYKDLMNTLRNMETVQDGWVHINLD
jgi:hypothetical protein